MYGSKKNTYLKIEAILLGWFCFISYFRFFAITQYSAVLHIGILSILPILDISERKKIKVVPGAILWILYAVIFSLGWASDLKTTTLIAWIIQKWMIVLIVIYLTNNVNWIDKIFEVFRKFALVHVGATFLEFLIPSFIHGVSGILLGAKSAEVTMQLFKYQYHCGIAQQASFDASYIAVAISIYFAFFIEGSKKKNWKVIIPLFMSVIALILTGKRGAIAAIVMAILCAFIVFLRYKRGTKIKYIGMALVVIAGVSWAVVNTDIAANIIRRMRYQDNFLTGRQILWETLAEGIRKHPFIGNGSASFSFVSSASGHNSLLQLWYENGLIGLSIVCVMFLCGLFAALNGYKKNCENKYGKYYIASFIYQIFFIVLCVTDSMFHHNITCICYVVFQCIPYALKNNKRKILSA